MQSNPTSGEQKGEKARVGQPLGRLTGAHRGWRGGHPRACKGAAGHAGPTSPAAPLDTPSLRWSAEANPVSGNAPAIAALSKPTESTRTVHGSSIPVGL